MRPVHDELLAALAEGLLEPGEARALQRVIADRPAVRRRWERLSITLVRPPVVTPLATGWGALGLGADAVMDAGPPRAGERVLVRLPALAGRWRPVLIGDGGSVVHPIDPTAWADCAGGEALPLVLPEGGVRWELLLVPAETPFEPPGPEAWLQQRLDAREGRLPGWLLEITTA